MRALDAEKTWRDLLGQVIKPQHQLTADTYLVPGKVQRFDIKLTPRLYAVLKGHSLRLTITAKNDPATQCNLLLGLTQARQCVYSAPQQATLPGGQYVVQRGLQTPSVITVPLIDPDLLPTAWSDYTKTSPTQTQALEWSPARH
jgi:predicted acyl esterase